MKLITISITSVLITSLLTLTTNNLQGQEEQNNAGGYNFEIVKELPHTTAKNQGIAGTCWSYATTSFLESELMRKGKDTVDLSELFFVYHAYIDKANRYVMRHGATNFSQGGQAHDVMNVIRKHGMVPEKIYSGKTYQSEEHKHYEMVGMMKGMLNSLKNRKEKMPIWIDAFNAVLNVYLGKIPSEFEWKGKKMTPKEFQTKMDINPDAYIELTAYNYYPLYEKVNLDIPDNWSFDSYYNVKLADLVETIDHAIANEYTVCWDGDVSEPGFNHDLGFAVLPNKKALENESFHFEIQPQKEVTTALREATFLSQKSTDDHLMHLIGTSKDQKGNAYYIIKNSWDTDSNELKGKLHMSKPYLKAKTIAIMVHQDAVPKQLKKKLNLR